MKNRFKELLRKPGKLTLYLLVLAAIVSGIFATSFGGTPQIAETMPRFYLLGIFAAFLLLFYVIAIQKGLSAGDAIFEMNDVNLLFVSPINPRATLLYGIVKLAGMSFWAGFFILFQGKTLQSFGVGFDGLLILFGAFILNMIGLTLLSLLIYSASNSSPARKRVVRVLAVAAMLPCAAYFGMHYLSSGDMLLSLSLLLNSSVFAATPFVGWTAAGAIALVGGDVVAGALWLGVLLAASIGMLLYIMLSRSDYYEDVLVATETAFERRRAAAEGDVQVSGSTRSKVRVKRTGLSGRGAQVFLYKHLRESFRKNRFGFFSLQMLCIAGGLIAASLTVFDGDMILTLLQILMWMQVFMIGTGRGLMETYSHYIYLIPVPPFQKILWSNLEVMVRALTESVLYLVIPGLLMGANFLVILACVLAYLCFSLLLLGINFLSMRFSEANISQGILIMVYLVAVLIFMAPGLAAGMYVGFMVGGLGGTLLGLAIITGWELAMALLCFALSKDILHRCDMPVVRPK